ncbi:hypothetical protein L9F63_026101, partial [Diploptera punctata]
TCSFVLSMKFVNVTISALLWIRIIKEEFLTVIPMTVIIFIAIPSLRLLYLMVNEILHFLKDPRTRFHKFHYTYEIFT